MFSIPSRALSWAITSFGNKFCLKMRSRLIKALNNRFCVKFMQLEIGLLLLRSVLKLFENVEWSNSLLRHIKIQTLLKINCCMAAISAFRVTQHRQIFSLFFRNRIQCIALYQLHNSQALFNLRRGYFRLHLNDLRSGITV